ncbi:hypothetical protein [Saccharomonospora iraqiensis]|uniref:hypothetical protein n=1 Tax=Saccharomonospora iraqiensis TaxID=52698 RepID=UPI00047B3594|nr:hypothetical protein [Saccharomonospora iraqiensis]
MRSVRRGIVTAALALPLAFGAAGVAAADKGGDVEANYASYEANIAAAGADGAVAGDVSSEAAGLKYEADRKDKKKHRSADGVARDAATDGEARHGKDKHKDRDRDKHHKHHKHTKKEAGWAHYEDSGAAAGANGAKAWDKESSAWYLDKK